jgi:hypothetical protein
MARGGDCGRAVSTATGTCRRLIRAGRTGTARTRQRVRRRWAAGRHRPAVGCRVPRSARRIAARAHDRAQRPARVRNAECGAGARGPGPKACPPECRSRTLPSGCRAVHGGAASSNPGPGCVVAAAVVGLVRCVATTSSRPLSTRYRQRWGTLRIGLAAPGPTLLTGHVRMWAQGLPARRIDPRGRTGYVPTLTAPYPSNPHTEHVVAHRPPGWVGWAESSRQPLENPYPRQLPATPQKRYSWYKVFDWR